MAFSLAPRYVFMLLAGLLLASFWLSLALGPLSLPLLDSLQALLRLCGVPLDGAGLQQAELIVAQIRLPRSVLGMCVGALLALSGVIMQGLFRNPLADPGLIGVSSGAALGAALVIVCGSLLAWPAGRTGCSLRRWRWPPLPAAVWLLCWSIASVNVTVALTLPRCCWQGSP